MASKLIRIDSHNNTSLFSILAWSLKNKRLLRQFENVVYRLLIKVDAKNEFDKMRWTNF